MRLLERVRALFFFFFCCAWPHTIHYFYGHWRYLASEFIAVLHGLKPWIRDRQHPADDNGMHRRGAVTAIQYPEHKVLPNLTQGHKRIWTHEWGHKLRGAGFISFSSAPAQPSPSFILDFVFWSRIFVSSLSLVVKNSLQTGTSGEPSKGRGLDQRLIGKGMKGKWAMVRCAGTCCSNPASPRQTCAALVKPPRLPPTPTPSSLHRVPFQSSSSSSSLTLLHKSHTKNPHAHTLKTELACHCRDLEGKWVISVSKATMTQVLTAHISQSVLMNIQRG